MTTNRVRVGIIAPGLWTGGAEMWMLSLARHCDPARIEWVGSVCRYPQNATGPMRRLIGQYMPVGLDTNGADALYANADVVLVWGIPTEDRHVPPPPRRCKVVLVSHSHGAKCEWTERVFANADDVDGIVGVSAVALNSVPPRYRAGSHIIPNCYEPERVRSEGERESLRVAWGVKPREIVVGYLGRFAPEKRLAPLIELAAVDRRVRVVLVGWGEEEPKLRLAADTLGVADRVVFAGAVERAGPPLSAFDWFVLASVGESCAIALLEAWAAGVPAICTPVGAAAEQPDCVRSVPPAPTGQHLAEALARDLADSPGLLARVQRAREVAKNLYSPERFGREWTEYLCEVAGPQPERPPLGDLFTGLSGTRAETLRRANECSHRSRPNWHAVCEAHRGGIDPHWVVSAEHCATCVDQSAHL